MKINVNAKSIYFDMDGTIANFYGVDEWLPLIRSHSTLPYEIAEPLCSMQVLARLLNRLQREGWCIGIISWTSNDESESYHEAVEKAKREWLAKHLASVQFDEIHIVRYGIAKHEVAELPLGILFDDNEGVRKEWSGTAFDVEDILGVLKSL